MNKKIIISLSVAAIVGGLALGATGAYFADTETSTGNTFSAGILDLKIKDGDEGYGDGITGTWTASDMKPGDEFAFTAPLVLLYKTYESIHADHTEITCDYSVIEESPQTESDTDPNTDSNPGSMAKEMSITRCVYRNDVWCIDCLEGKKYDAYTPTQSQCAGSVLSSSNDWEIEDQNSDGKISFYDLKNDDLDNLPPANSETKFEMSVKFDEDASNDFQGDTFDLTMIFLLNQEPSPSQLIPLGP